MTGPTTTEASGDDLLWLASVTPKDERVKVLGRHLHQWADEVRRLRTLATTLANRLAAASECLGRAAERGKVAVPAPPWVNPDGSDPLAVAVLPCPMRPGGVRVVPVTITSADPIEPFPLEPDR